MLSISPDGGSIAWRKTNADSDAVVVYSLQQKQVLGGFSLDGKVDPSSLSFVTSDKLVLVASENTRVSGFRGKFDVSNAFVFDLGERELKTLLAPVDNVYPGQSGLGRIIGLSGDRRYVYMPAYSGESTLYTEPPFSLFRVDLENPRRPKIEVTGKRRTRDYFVDADGEPFVHEYYDDNGSRHVVEVRDGKSWREIYSLESELPQISLIGLTSDYEYLVVASYDSQTRRRVYFRMSVADGSFAGALFAREDADVAGVVSDINRVVHGARYGGLRPTYEFFDDRLNERMARIQAMVPDNSVELVDWTAGWAQFIVYVSGPGYAGTYFVFGDDQRPLMQARARPWIDDAAVHPVVVFAYAAEDGLEIPALITIPRQRMDSLEGLPAVVLPHGGPGAHDTVGFDWFAQALADQGYLVIQPQFRGSTGFGLDHRNAGNGEWGRKMQSDLSDGVAALVADGYVDPDRVCIAGMSYGGYAALAGGAFTPDLYRCIVSVNGVSDLSVMVDQHRRDSDNETVMAYLAETVGQDGELNRRYLDSISPAEFADAFEAPVLLLHGEDDEVVPIRHSELMHSRLKRAKKDVTFIELDEDSHYLHVGTNRIELLREVLAFLDEHLGDAD